MSAKQRGSYVVAHYDWHELTRRQRSQIDGISVTVLPAAVEDIPIGRTVRRNRAGKVRIPLPLGDGPYSVIAVSVTELGQRSREVHLPVR